MKKLRFLVAVFKNYTNAKIVNYTMTVNMSNAANSENFACTKSPLLKLRVVDLLFRFSNSCMGHLNKTQTEIVENFKDSSVK